MRDINSKGTITFLKLIAIAMIYFILMVLVLHFGFMALSASNTIANILGIIILVMGMSTIGLTFPVVFKKNLDTIDRSKQIKQINKLKDE